MSFRNDLIGTSAEANTPSDTAFVNYVALYIGTGGDVAVQHVAGTSVTYKNAASGSTITTAPIIRVMSTSTTATDIIGVKPT